MKTFTQRIGYRFPDTSFLSDHIVFPSQVYLYFLCIRGFYAKNSAEVVFPYIEVVASGLHIEDMGNPMLLQVEVSTFAERHQVVIVPAGYPQQF